MSILGPHVDLLEPCIIEVGLRLGDNRDPDVEDAGRPEFVNRHQHGPLSTRGVVVNELGTVSTRDPLQSCVAGPVRQPIGLESLGRELSTFVNRPQPILSLRREPGRSVSRMEDGPSQEDRRNKEREPTRWKSENSHFPSSKTIYKDPRRVTRLI